MQERERGGREIEERRRGERRRGEEVEKWLTGDCLSIILFFFHLFDFFASFIAGVVRCTLALEKISFPFEEMYSLILCCRFSLVGVT